MQSLVSFVCMIIIAFVTKTLYVCVSFCASYFPLRHFAGGYHQNTKLKCFVTSEAIYLVIAIISKVDTSYIHHYAVEIIVLFFSFATIFAKAPVDNENRRITPEQKKKYRRDSIAVCFVLNILMFIFYLMGKTNILFGFVSGIVVECIFLLMAKKNPQCD